MSGSPTGNEEASPKSGSSKWYHKSEVKKRLGPEKWAQHLNEQYCYCHRHVIESLAVNRDGEPTYKLAHGSLSFHVQTFIKFTVHNYDEWHLRRAIVESVEYKQKYRLDNLGTGFLMYQGLRLRWHIEYWRVGERLTELPFFQFRGIEFRVAVNWDGSGR